MLFASLIDDPDQPDVPEELLRQIDRQAGWWTNARSPIR
ncbi:MAG: hypothetical protein KME03_16570 [Aphanocapsa lilacina HA4352-LM1]|nr:hypothetical protein [Aphanocapsa lilacina HA4352-LM1]